MKLILIGLIITAVLLSGCISEPVNDKPLTVSEVVVSASDTAPDPLPDPTPVTTPVTTMEKKYPVWCTFNMMDGGVEYAARFDLYDSGSCTMIMRSDQGNKIWHANWELVTDTDVMLVYKIWGRNGALAIDNEGNALIKGSGIPETFGTWKHPRGAE